MHPGNVHLHFLDLDASADALIVCQGLLDATERDRARRFLRKNDADRWTVARAGLKDILASYCGIQPRDVRFRTERNSKPVMEDVPGRDGVHFNLSHSGAVAAVAVTRLGPVGVDVEYRRTIPDWREVASRFFSASEYNALIGVAAAQRDDAFLRCWTRKEAVIKATGEGLSAELDSFDVSFEPDRPPEVLRHGSEPGSPGAWTLGHFESDTFVGAVALCRALPFELVTEGFWDLPHGPSTSNNRSPV